MPWLSLGSYARTVLLRTSGRGRALKAALRTEFALPRDPAVWDAMGRVVVELRGAGLAAVPAPEQLARARAVADIARRHVAAGRALVVAFEDSHAAAGGTETRRVEVVFLAASTPGEVAARAG